LSMPMNIIARATAMFMGLCASAFLPSLVYALYGKRHSAFPASLSLAAGAISWFLWTVFVHKAEAEPLGISQMLFGRVTLLDAPFTVVDPLIIGLPIATIALVMGLAIERRADARVDAEAA